PLPHRRRQLALLLGVLGAPLLGFVLDPLRSTLGTPGALLLFLLFIVGIAIMGGAVPALVVAVLAFGVADWFFIPPLHNLTIGHPVDAISLVVFLTVAVAVSAVGERAARRPVLAAPSQAGGGGGGRGPPRPPPPPARRRPRPSPASPPARCSPRARRRSPTCCPSSG